MLHGQPSQTFGVLSRSVVHKAYETIAKPSRCDKIRCISNLSATTSIPIATTSIPRVLIYKSVFQSNSATLTMSGSAPASSQAGIPSHALRPVTTPGLRYPSTKKTIYDRNLNRTKTAELSRSAFAYLFIEMINYAQRQVKGITDLEKRLNHQGYPLGLRLLDLLLSRTTPQPSISRPTRILALLQFIHTNLWKHLFGRAADALERSAANPAEYMISDNEPLVNQYVSVPREMSQLNCAAFVAGIVEGVCDGAGFKTVGVSAHWASDGEASGDKMWPGKTVFLLRFSPEVLEREEALGRVG